MKLKIGKYVLSVLLFAILSYSFILSPSSGDLPIIFSATTDKSNYEYGDTIKLIYTVENLSDTTVVLWFGSSCQFDYYIDEYHYLSNIACLAIVTSITIPPETTLVFNKYHNNSYYLPGVGEHSFKGILIGYDTVSTNFTITDPLNVSVIYNSPKSFFLSQNYPNPFNTETIISFSIPELDFVSLKIYDVLGIEVETLVNEEISAGVHQVSFDAKGVSSGIYFYKIKAGSYIETKKMVLLK